MKIKTLSLICRISTICVVSFFIQCGKVLAQWSWQHASLNNDSTWLCTLDTSSSNWQVYAGLGYNVHDSVAVETRDEQYAYVIRHYNKGVCNGPDDYNYYDTTIIIPFAIQVASKPIYVEYYGDTFRTDICTDLLLPRIDTVAILYRWPLLLRDQVIVPELLAVQEGSVLTLSSSNEVILPITLNCISILGQQIFINKLHGNSYDISTLPLGLYYVHIEIKERRQIVKFIKR